MHGTEGLTLALLYLLATVFVVVVFRFVKMPPILGYLAVGVLIGPNALNWTGEPGGIEGLAEFGVVFLMFVIGLEFSLSKMRKSLRFVFVLGAAEVLGVMGILGLAAVLFGYAFSSLGVPWQTVLAVSGAIAMSSTAIVGKMMADRQELESEHGRRVMGVLLFQDLAVVPLLVLLPALGNAHDALGMALLGALTKAAVIVVLLLVGGAWLMRHWLRVVAMRKSDELFMLNLLLMTLGLAWLTEKAGLSLALGAFIAGMLISETEYKHRVEVDVKPFHDVLLGLFFITIGMMLDLVQVWEQWPLVLLFLLVPLLLKLGWIGLVTYWLGASTGVSVRTGLYLAQMGEFGIVLLTLAQQHQLLPPQWFNPLLAAMVLSMMLTPMMILYSNQMLTRLSSSEWLQQSLQMTRIAQKAIQVEKHVIICGYGRCGQNMAKLLTQQKIPYLALDIDPDRVRQAATAGESVVYGDATRLQTLMAAGLARAATVVITYLEMAPSLRTVKTVRAHTNQAAVVVRTQDEQGIERFQSAGATATVPEALEASLMLTGQVLILQGLPMRKVMRVIQEQRSAHYSLLKGYFRGYDDEIGDDLEHLISLEVMPDSPVLGQSLANLALYGFGVRSVSLRRSKGEVLTPPEESAILVANDVLVMAGTPEDLARVREVLFGEESA